ncbi:cylicin-2-like isoform X2 [Tenebrio molitor]|uniref:cylicin-2-like isoform X2 n=1 Tax=Tenebrio molitor TaxID=7067 RepID=UPI00362486CD
MSGCQRSSCPYGSGRSGRSGIANVTTLDVVPLEPDNSLIDLLENTKMLITAITNVTQNVKNHIEKRKARREGGKSKTSTCTWPSVGTTVTAENVNELLKSRTQDDKGFRSCSCTTTGLSENQQDLVNTTAPDPRVVENSGLGPCRCAETYEKLRASLSNKLNRQSTIVEEKPLKSCACASTNTEPPKEEAKAESGGEPPAESTKEGSVKGESQAESTKRESKAESVKEELQESVIGEPLAESSRRESKAESVKGESQAESTKRESKAESMKGESQSESIKRDSKADSTKRESKAESTKQESKAESIKEEPQAESKAEAPVEAPPQDEPKPEPEPEPPKEEAAPEPQTEQSEPPAEAEPEAEAPPKDVSVVDKAKDVDVTGQVAAGVGSPGVTPEVEHLPEASPIPDQTSKINSPASRKSSDKAKPQPLPKDCRRGLNTSDLYKIPPFKDKMSADMGRGPSLPKDCRRGLSEFKDAPPVRDKHLTSDDLARGRSKDCRKGSKMNALGSDIPEKKHDSLVGTKVKPVDCKCKDCQERRGSAQAANRPCATSLAKDPKECLKECPKQKVAQPGKVKMTVVHRSVPKLNAGLN